ncbi:MAG: helix-turn-helix transcriptional regulator [Clostridia bacterium]|nr:helix-turn-helix transcriptional regulator [Clostridia bacterium]
MKKFNENRNVIGKLVKEYREKNNYTKTQLSHKLELLGIELDRFELYKLENGLSSVKDFELIGLCIVLNIDFEELKKLVS